MKAHAVDDLREIIEISPDLYLRLQNGAKEWNITLDDYVEYLLLNESQLAEWSKDWIKK